MGAQQLMPTRTKPGHRVFILVLQMAYIMQKRRQYHGAGRTRGPRVGSGLQGMFALTDRFSNVIAITLLVIQRFESGKAVHHCA